MPVANGYIYPPLYGPLQSHQEKQKFSSNPPKTINPFYTLDSTHTITLPSVNDEKSRFLILCYGFLHGVYLMPADYNHIKITPYEVGKLTGVLPPDISESVKGMEAFNSFYDNSPDEQRKLLYSIINWFLLGQCYEYAWDRFTAQYFVLDAIFKFSGLNCSHAQRPEELAKHYNLPLPTWAKYDAKTRSCKVSILRNELFHEAKYAGEPIGYKYPDENFDLEFVRFNLQLIISIIGLNSPILRKGVGSRGMDGWNFQ